MRVTSIVRSDGSRLGGSTGLELRVGAGASGRNELQPPARTERVAGDAGRTDSPSPHAQLYSCSWLLLDRISTSSASGRVPEADRNAFLAACRVLSTTQLVEMLKWPFCVGEAEHIVLEELGAKKAGRLATDFQGSLGEFIRFAQTRPELRPLLATPAKRPRADDALRDLEGIVAMSLPH